MEKIKKNKKTTKIAIALFLLILVILYLFCSLRNSSVEAKGYYLCRRTSLGYEIVGLTKDTPEEIVIPSNFDNTPVVAVASSICSNLPVKSITLPRSVNSIGNKAFDNIHSMVIILEGRENADGMKLGKDWSGDATVIFGDSKVTVDSLKEKEPDKNKQTSIDKPIPGKDDINGVYIPPIQPNTPDFKPGAKDEQSGNYSSVSNNNNNGQYQIGDENNKFIKTLTSISVDTPPDKIKYIEGNLFDKTGMVVTAHYSDKTSQKVIDFVISSPPLMVSTKSVMISYTQDGITKNISQAIEVIKKVPTNLKVVTQPNKARYIEGNVFDKKGMVVNVSFDNLNDTNTTAFSVPTGKLIKGQTSITVSYTENNKEVTAIVPITVVAKTPTKLQIDTPPDKIRYIEGNVFDKTGMVIKSHYDNEDIIVIKDFVFPTDKLIKGQTSITISYKENGKEVTAVVPITVVAKTPTKLEVTSPPNKIRYIEGNVFDKTGMVVKVSYDNGDTPNITSFIVPTNKLIKAQTNITVSYKENGKEVTAVQVVTVVAKTPTRLEIATPPDKTRYIEGNVFDKSGMVVKAYYDNQDIIVITDFVVPTQKLIKGQKSITISYTENGKEVTAIQPITVVAKTPTKLEIANTPDKTKYIEGNVFDKTGMVVKAHYDNQDIIVITDFVVPTDRLIKGQKSITISYTENDKEVTAIQPITVVAKTPTKLEITSPPSKTRYIEGNVFDKSGMVVKAHYDNQDIIVISDFTVPTNKLIKGQTNITVSYTENGKKVTVEQPITVVAKTPTKLEITKQPTKTNYSAGLIFRPEGMIAKASYDNGDIANVTNYTYPAERLKEGQTFVRISYSENNTHVTVNVAVNVGPQLAVYEKHNVKSEQKVSYELYLKYANSGRVLSINKAFTRVELNKNTGEVTGYDMMYPTDVGEGGYVYYIQSTTSYSKCSLGHLSTAYYESYVETLGSTKVFTTVYSRGTYLADITVVANTLPADGRHTDGSWYVFKNLIQD